MPVDKLILFPNSEATAITNHLANLFITFCRSQNEKIPQKTAFLITRILLLNSEWGRILKNGVTKDEIQNFIEACFNFLYKENNISCITLKLQTFFYGRYLSREQFQDQRKQIMLKNCFHLLQKLKKVWHNPTEDLHDMHNDLIKLILIKEGMDDKDDHTAFEEMKTAVNSVFPTSALSTFVLSNQKTKMAFINEVSSIAAGIRLHAWYSRKAGKFMFDVGKIMKETLPKVCEDLHEEFNDLNKKVGNLQKQLVRKTVEGDTVKNSDFYWEELLLINLTNFLKFAKVLKEDIDEISVQTYKLDYKFTVQIKELNAALKCGPFTKADRVYPLYKSVAQTWKSMQLEGHLLDFYIKLFQELKKIFEHINLIETKCANKVANDGEGSESTKEKQSSKICTEKTHMIYPEDVKNFLEITLEYQDFCAYYCSLGILVPSDKCLGIVMYKNSYYGFSSKEAMDYFKKQPDNCTDNAKTIMLNMPELMITLGMEEYFHFPVINNFKHKKILPVFIADSSTQTVLHPVKKNIDYSYNWNQWDLRRQALKYADLLNKKTHSTQTDLSHFRRENYSQVYLPKDNWTQTRRDASTSMSRTGIPELYRFVKKTFL